MKQGAGSKMTEDQIRQLIQEAILAERARLTRLLNESDAKYRTTGPYGNTREEFDWSDTVGALAEKIESPE